jgi:phosphocarrier protein
MAIEVKSFIIKNKLGLHARAAGLLVQKANRFACDIKIEKDGLEVDAKSIMGVMMLAAAKDCRVILKAEGADAQKALRALGDLFEGKFGEE